MASDGPSRALFALRRAGKLLRLLGWALTSLLSVSCTVLIDESFDGYRAAIDGGSIAMPLPEAGVGGDDADSPQAGEDASPGSTGGAGSGGAGATGNVGQAGAAGAGKVGMDAGGRAGAGGEAGATMPVGPAVIGGSAGIAENGGAAGGAGSAGQAAVGGSAGNAGNAGNASAGAEAGAPGDAVLPLPADEPQCAGAIKREVSFDLPGDIADFAVASPLEVPQMPVSTQTANEGSPALGALSVEATYTRPSAVVKLGTSFMPTAVACMSVRVKFAPTPNTAGLSTNRAAWLLYAVDESHCYAEVKAGQPPNDDWRYELDRAGVWYTLTSPTAALVPASTCGGAFNAERISMVGLGIAAPRMGTASWPVQFFVDTFRLH